MNPTDPNLVDHAFSLGSIAVLLSLIVAVLTITGSIRKSRRENEADAQARTDRLMTEISKHNDSVEKRLNTVETKIVDFMPRSEIEAKIEHEKNNRIMAFNGHKATIDKHDESIVGIRVEVGKISQKSDGIVNEMGEIKLIIKEMARDTSAQLEKMTDKIGHVAMRS